jgi:hypothetical protein
LKRIKSKIRNQFKRKQITDKLRSIPSAEAFISEFDLFFPLPTPTYDPVKKKKKLSPLEK